jgi:hypothetical protein
MEIAMNQSNHSQGRGRANPGRAGQERTQERAQQRPQGRNINPPAAEADYFNLHASGCGYLSRVRWVDPKQKRGGRSGEGFLACAINALRGEVSNPSYTYFDLRVSGEEASRVVEDLKQAVDENRKVFVAFKLGDFYAEKYDRPVLDAQGRKTDQMETKVLIKGRLLLVTHAKVDGEVVFEREDGAGDQTGGPSQPSREASPTHGEADGEPNSSGEVDGAEGLAGDDEPVQPPAQRARPAYAGRGSAANGASMDRTRVRSYHATGTHG